MKVTATLIMASVITTQHVVAFCGAVPENRMTLTVESCEAVVPSRHPAIAEVIDNIPDEFNKNRIAASYSGLVLTAGGSRYFINESVAQSCATFGDAKVIDALVQTACCDGDPNASCLLGTSKYIAEYGSKP